MTRQTDGSLLFRLSGGEACKLTDQCADVLRTSDAWFPQVLVDAQLSDEHVRTLRSYAVSLTCFLATAFHWRVVLLVDRYAKIQRLADTNMSLACESRRAAASNLMSLQRNNLQCDVTVSKFVQIFAHDLQDSSSAVTASPRLWATANAFRTLLGSNVSHIEGLNGILKTLAKNSPTYRYHCLIRGHI